MQNSFETTSFTITGAVFATSFPPWIKRHARKLGIEPLTVETTPQGIRVTGAGPPEMLEALVIACSLGPADVLVDTVTGFPTNWQMEA